MLIMKTFTGYYHIFLTVVLLTGLLNGGIFSGSDSLKYAGFRASRILQSYPGNQFPSPAYWSSAGYWMAGKFHGANPAGVWIVSLYISNGQTQMNFPSGGISLPNVSFISTDQNENYLSYFDQQGIKVWLQVEPGAASVDTLIYVVLNRYKHHACVAGFGVDVEWLDTHLYSGGRKVTDTEAQRWESKVKAVNPSYTLFLKHYGQSWMPPNYRGNLMFIDDSQIFSNLNQLVNEFKSWGNKFAPNKVGFQIGYPRDSVWWSLLNDPPSAIGAPLFNNIPNCIFVAWVDFTLNKVFPVTGLNEERQALVNSVSLSLFPNPANASVELNWNIPENSESIITVYDVTGSVVIRENAGVTGRFNLDITVLVSGTYIVRVSSGGFTDSRKLVVLK